LNTDGAYAFIRHDKDNTLLRWAAVTAGNLSLNNQKLLVFENIEGVSPDISSNCSAAASYEDDCVRLSIKADKPGDVSIYVPFSFLSCTLNGQPISTEYDSVMKLINFHLPAGQHEVLILD